MSEIFPEVCLSCRFYLDGSGPAFTDAHGVCRRRAPRIPLMPRSGGWQTFPPTARWQWCGEYEEVAGARDEWEKRQAAHVEKTA